MNKVTNNFELLAKNIDTATQLLKILSHPDRLKLLCQLVQGAACVSELEELTGIKQPSLSQQLGILRQHRLVSTSREGRQIYYSICSDDALAVMQVLYERFCSSNSNTVNNDTDINGNDINGSE